ncbi:MAG: FtsX-like permease family protein [Acidobacteria bacterium]|nr:FtsX-like permease family protein [Acidobacteriota bacterium]
MTPRWPLALVRWLLPGDVGESVAREIATAHDDNVGRRGRMRAAIECWREALSPSVLQLRRELRVPTHLHLTSNLPPGPSVLNHFLSDIRLAVRGLRARPGFALTAILIIAVGIGASTAIFTVVDHVLLRQLPFDSPERLVTVDDPGHTVPMFRRWHEETGEIFEHFAAAFSDAGALTGSTVPSEVHVAFVRSEFFPALGVAPAVGRGFVAEDHQPTAEVAVISHGAWVRLFGSDAAVVGREIHLNQTPRTIVGVLPAGFEPPEILVGARPEFWLPFTVEAGSNVDDWGSHFLSIIGRLRPDQNLIAVSESLDAVTARIRADNPAGRDDPIESYGFGVTPLLQATVGDVGDALYLLLGAVGLMLLIACANVASLLLARSTERHQEVAVRAALGASRGRIIQQLITEALVLSLAGGAVGLAAALGAVEWFNVAQPGNIPRSGAVAIDLRILAVAFGTALLTGLVFGVAPALRAARSDLNTSIRDGGNATSASARRQHLRSGLVVVEVALAVVLTVGAGLLFGSFVRMNAVDPGFETDQLLSFRLTFGTYAVDERTMFVEQARAALETIPGVESVGAGITVPFAITGAGRCCWFDELVAAEDDPGPHVAIFNPVDEGYFTTLGARLRQGRSILPTDGDEDPVAVVTLSTARSMFGRDDVVGEVLDVEGDLNLRIVGVVEDIRHWGLAQQPENEIYVPHRGFGHYFQHAEFLVRGSRAGLASEIREAIWTVDSELPVDEIVAMQQLVARSVAAPRFYSGVLVVFSAVALLLAAGGVYGTLMFQVGQRRREIGIRMALGARVRDVVGTVVSRGVLLASMGLALGVVGALALGRVVESLMFGITSTDPATFVLVAITLLAVAFAASYLPARRAGRCDPASSLRSQ